MTLYSMAIMSNWPHRLAHFVKAWLSYKKYAKAILE